MRTTGTTIFTGFGQTWFWLLFPRFLYIRSGGSYSIGHGTHAGQHLLDLIQREKALSELELLKQQINPHFLFNALNTVYYKIDRSNGQARETLQRFSNMLRYQLYECNHELVAIEKELLFIRSYVDLQKERLNDNYKITCDGLNDIGLLISPFLLLPLIENCFKHVSGYPDRENAIFIDCFVEGDTFRLHTRNSIADGLELNKGKAGIGLENVRRRLGLVYPGKHELITGPEGIFYEARLRIEIG